MPAALGICGNEGGLLAVDSKPKAGGLDLEWGLEHRGRVRGGTLRTDRSHSSDPSSCSCCHICKAVPWPVPPDETLIKVLSAGSYCRRVRIL